MIRSLLRKVRTTHEGLKRSVVKTGVYRGVMVMITVAVAFFFTEDAGTSVSIGLVTNVVKTFTYFGYERMWARVGWGYGGG